MSVPGRHDSRHDRRRFAGRLLCLALAMPLTGVAADQPGAYPFSQSGMGLAGGALLGGFTIEPEWSVDADALDVGAGLAGDDAGFDSEQSDDIYTLRTVRLFGAGTLPVSPGLSLFGKVGVTGLGLRAHGLQNVAANSGLELSYSAGGLYSFSPNLSLHAEWDRYAAGQGDIDLFSAGIRYDFK